MVAATTTATATQPISLARKIRGRRRGRGAEVAVEGHSTSTQQTHEMQYSGVGGSGRRRAAHTKMQSGKQEVHEERCPAHQCTGDYVRAGCHVCIAIDQAPSRFRSCSLAGPISFWPARLFANLFCAQYETRKMHEAQPQPTAHFPIAEKEKKKLKRTQ